MEAEKVIQKPEIENSERRPITSEIIDAFDIEWRLFFTFRDFYLKPEYVIKSYATDKDEYSNPLKLILICGTMYWLITSFLIDWNNIGQSVGNGYAAFLKNAIFLIDSEASSNEKLENFVGTFKTFASVTFIFLMEYLGIYVMLIALLQSALLYKFTRDYGSNFKEIAGFLCYRASSFIILFLLLLPFGLINYWLPLILLMSISIYIEYLRKSSKFSIFQYLNVPVKLGKKFQMKTMLIIFTGAGIFGMLVGIIFGFQLFID